MGKMGGGWVVKMEGKVWIISAACRRGKFARQSESPFLGLSGIQIQHQLHQFLWGHLVWKTGASTTIAVPYPTKLGAFLDTPTPREMLATVMYILKLYARKGRRLHRCLPQLLRHLLLLHRRSTRPAPVSRKGGMTMIAVPFQLKLA